MHFLTISQMLGTDGERIAKKVASDLKYSFYGEQELFKAAEDTENVRLFGFTSSKEEKGRVESAVKRVKGIREIQNEIKIFPQGMGGV